MSEAARAYLEAKLAKNRQAWGIARELIAALGGALIAFGVANELAITAIVGAITAAGTLGVAVMLKDDYHKISTVFRKALSTVGAALVTLGVIRPEHVEAIAAVVMPALALWWSFRSNGKPPDPWPRHGGWDDYEPD